MKKSKVEVVSIEIEKPKKVYKKLEDYSPEKVRKAREEQMAREEQAKKEIIQEKTEVPTPPLNHSFNESSFFQAEENIKLGTQISPMLKKCPLCNKKIKKSKVFNERNSKSDEQSSSSNDGDRVKQIFKCSNPKCVFIETKVFKI